MATQDNHPALCRRKFLFAASAALGGLSASPGFALPFLRRTPAQEAVPPRSLVMVNQQTDEVFNEVYFNGEAYLQESLDRFAHFARDLRNGEVGEMDPYLLDLASDVQSLIGANEPLILTHGFRSSSANVRRGARNSRHLHGQALDIAHHRLRPRDLYQLADSLGRGGLGRYGTFIHIDTGPTRRW